VKFKLDENLPASSAAILAGAGHDVDTVGQEGLSGATDPEVVAAATVAGRVSKAVSDLAALTNATAWPEQYRSCNTGYCESVILERTPSPQGEDIKSASC
jgi:predicted nuclease of predicted toxin-antitoxin system